MRIHKSLKLALNMVLHSKLRSWLTILGIVIGVASVIAIVALGDGMEASMNSQLSGKGADLLTLSAGASRGGGFGGHPGEGGGGGGSSGASTNNKTPELTDNDVQVLRGVSLIGSIDTQISGRADIYYIGQSGTASVTGVDQTVWAQMTNPTILEGRALGPADTNVVVIGGRLNSGYFNNKLGINNAINIEGKAFRVVGVLNDTSTNIYMPINYAYQVLSDKDRGVYDRIVMQVRDPDLVSNASAQATELLAIRRHTTAKPDFSISDPSAMLATRQQMLSSLTMFLTAIAGVALIVGAVGIANTMFTSVLEKTKQIGIMKAIGATRTDILLLFLFNAAIIGLIGGIIGVICGYALAQILPMFLSLGIGRGETVAIVRLSPVLYSLGVSVLIGVLAGAIPAWTASKLKPVDALRYE